MPVGVPRLSRANLRPISGKDYQSVSANASAVSHFARTRWRPIRSQPPALIHVLKGVLC